MEDETKTHSINLFRRRMDQAPSASGCLVVIAGPAMGERFPIAKTPMVIGRQRGSGIWIDDDSVSRKHAEVIPQEDGPLLRDLGSKNGTFCNNQKISERRLQEGDLIRIGDATLKYLSPNSVERPYLDEMSERATRDGLTGLFNKETFQARLERDLSRCKELRAPLSVVLIDLDLFKKINDGWGHPAGDAVLKTFAEQVKRSVRPSDLLARIGGEEFGLILPRTYLKEALLVGERIRNRIAGHPFVFEGHTLPVTVSAGIAEWKEPEPGDPLVARADKALYKAKHEGRNRTCPAE
jgi:diguanylate cyclase (GGDEF)-like protein